MHKLIYFIRRTSVAILFVVIEIIAIRSYAYSTPYTQARLLGMSTILQKLSECGEGLILTGDMNARPDSLPITAARAFDGGRLLEASEPIDVTFHAWGTRAIKIDYIFSDFPALGAHHVTDEPVEGQPYISDHYPVALCAEF